MTLWFKDIIAESTYLGDHIAVKEGLNQGFLLFVVNEIIFGYYSELIYILNPTMEIGMSWPPMGVEAISPAELPY